MTSKTQDNFTRFTPATISRQDRWSGDLSSRGAEFTRRGSLGVCIAQHSEHAGGSPAHFFMCDRSGCVALVASEVKTFMAERVKERHRPSAPPLPASSPYIRMGEVIKRVV